MSTADGAGKHERLQQQQQQQQDIDLGQTNNLKASRKEETMEQHLHNIFGMSWNSQSSKQRHRGEKFAKVGNCVGVQYHMTGGLHQLIVGMWDCQQLQHYINS